MRFIERFDLLLLLSIMSFSTLVSNSILLYSLCEAVFLAFAINRIYSAKKVSLWRLEVVFTLVIAFLANLAMKQVVPSGDSIIRVVNFSLMCLVATPQDAFKIINNVKYLLYLNLMFSIAVYLNVLPTGISGHFYDYILLFGRPINSGFVFEANYAGIVGGLLVFLPRAKIRNYAATILSELFFTFRTGFLAPIADLSSKIGWKFLVIGVLVGWLFLLAFLYYLGPVGLEQRYYIWSSFFSFYEWGHIYSVDEVQRYMRWGMQESPWGESGLNLHSGIFESILYRGLAYSVVSLVVLIIAIRNANMSALSLLVYFLIISTVFSVSFGGINLVSLCFSMIVAGYLDKENDTETGVSRKQGKAVCTV